MNEQAIAVASKILDLLWLLPGAIALYGVKYLAKLSKSQEAMRRDQADIKHDVSLIHYRLDDFEQDRDDHEARIRDIERGRHSGQLS